MPTEEWDPSKPLEDKDLEEEAQSRAKQRARLKYLEDENLAKIKKETKKKGFFD